MSRETDLAWVAGMADGEGHIGLSRELHHRGRHYYRPIFNITNTDLVGVRRCAEVMGRGNVYVHHYAKPPRRTAYLWGVRGPDVAESLTLLLPYLVMKTEQAQLVIRAVGLKAKRGQRQTHSKELEWIYRQLRALHQGAGDIATPLDAGPQSELDI